MTAFSKAIAKIITLTMLLTSIGSLLFSGLKVEAQDYSITIVHLGQTESEHLLTEKPTNASLAIEGTIFELWEILDYDYSQDDYQAKLNELNAMSTEELTSKYSQGHQISSPTDNSGSTRFLNLQASSYYIRDTGVSLAVNSVPFLITLPVSDEFGELLTDITVYPKTNFLTGQVELIKYKAEDEDKLEDREPFEDITFQLFAQSDEEGLYPLGVNNNGEFQTDLSGSNLVTDINGKIFVSLLPIGSYYFKEIANQSPYKLDQTPLTFNVIAGETVYLEMNNYPIQEGGYKFRKISSTKPAKELQGAQFKVAKKLTEDGATKYEFLQEEGKDIILTSNEKGQFEITGLPLGTYYLIETVAPKVDGVTYQLNSQPIEFVVSSVSYDTVEMDIINRPTGPPSIPPTGDWMVYAMVGGLIIIFGIGFYLYRKSELKD